MNQLKSEWIKVTTTKSAYWLYAIGIGLAVVLAVVIGQFEQPATGDPMAGAPGGGSDPLFAILGVSAFTVLLAWIAAIVGVTGEYRYHTIKATFLTTPSRWPAIVAKTALFTVLAIDAFRVNRDWSLPASAVACVGVGWLVNPGQMLVIGLVLYFAVLLARVWSPRLDAALTWRSGTVPLDDAHLPATDPRTEAP